MTDEVLQLSKLIDWTVALVPTATERYLIGKAFRNLSLWLGSLNQTIGPYSECACFMDLEIKKTHTARDSRLQIATWAGAAVKKRRYHKWDTSFAMPAVTVDGHKWDLYIFWEDGTTKDIVSHLSTQYILNFLYLFYSRYTESSPDDDGPSKPRIHNQPIGQALGPGQMGHHDVSRAILREGHPRLGEEARGLCSRNG